MGFLPVFGRGKKQEPDVPEQATDSADEDHCNAADLPYYLPTYEEKAFRKVAESLFPIDVARGGLEPPTS